MEFTDTHIHLYAEEFTHDRTALVKEALAQGVNKLLMPNIDSSTVLDMLALQKQFPDVCYPMMGLHPCYVKENYQQELAKVRKELEKGTYYAVGEIGLDRYWDLTFYEQQVDALTQQLKWAHELNLPVALHTREANEECIALIEKLNLPGLKGIFHCFSGTLEQAQRMIELGFYLGIGGVLTFKKSGLDEIVSQLSLDNLVLETDGPYLAPTPHRGKRNEPAYLKLVAEKMAEIKRCTVEEVAATTSRNAQQLFQL